MSSLKGYKMNNNFNNKKICFIGSGQMAESIVNGILKKNVFENKDVFCADISDERLSYLEEKYNLNTFNIQNFDNFLLNKDLENMVFVLSVKPNNADDIFEVLKSNFKKNKINVEKNLIISIMAGKKIQQIQRGISIDESFPQTVRVMPNTPALLGEGAIAYAFSDNCSNENKMLAGKVLSAIGICAEVKENELDAITALSGSGPAYVFYLAEAMIDAGVAMGLTEEISKKLAIQTILGSGKMLALQKDEPKELRKKVTSKGGTTQAAIEYFDEKQTKEIIKEALNKAKNRSIELSKN
jgi:pyrroline-5-carboxylate reductase